MRCVLTVMSLAVAVAGCGGAGGPPSRVAYAEGPIRTACLRSDRRAAGDALCGCVQASADATLSRRDQRRAVRFFGDPHQAQVVRQSDRGSDEAFWRRYKVFISQAERSCR